jgi:hypothetical protein
MKNPGVSALATAVGLGITACNEVPTSTAPGEHQPLFRAAAKSTAPVVTFADPEGDAVGTSQLVRTDNGVSVKLSTTGLEPGTAATLWIIIFNEPDNCTAPECGEDDLFRAEPLPDVMYMGGSVVGGTGGATFAGHRAEGDNSRSLWAVLGVASPSPGLIDARVAEIHLVVRNHGPLIRGLIGEMTSTFNGGCPLDGLPVNQLIGTPGPNTCEDVQFVVHTP